MEQHQTVQDGAIAVQILGDGNTVMIGAMRFAHSQLHKRRAEPSDINGLLRTDLRATTLVGREKERKMLAEWLVSSRTISVRCITGDAGAGKTRLAIEACEVAEQQGWFAMFAPSGELKRFHEAQNLVNWKFPGDALIVVDYAATAASQLLDWFAALAPHRDAQGHKLRLLLLERHASKDTGWWAELLRPHSLDRASAGDLIEEKLPYALPTLDAVQDRRALLTETMVKAGKLLGLPHLSIAPPAPGVDPALDRRLALSRPENEPLYLIMAGIHAVQQSASAALALSRLELAEQIALVEKDRLEKFAQAHGFATGDPLPAHVVASVTLQNGCALADLAKLIEEERAALKLPITIGAEDVARIVGEYLPQEDNAVAPIRPDLIGESFLLSVLENRPVRNGEVQANIVLRAWRRNPEGVLNTLIRCARDLAHGDSTHPSVRWLRVIVAQSSDLEELIRISDSVPQQTLALREFGAEVGTRITEVARALTPENPSTFMLLATSLNNLGARLNALGRHEEAFAATEEAVRLCRQLAAENHDICTSLLAGALNNLVTSLMPLGQPEDALAAGEESVQLRRRLAVVRPDVFMADLASSLHNVASVLRELRRREDAMAAATEALDLRRQLAATHPDESTPEVAASLNNIANHLSGLGQREEALAAAEEALQLYRNLATSRPDAFTPHVAGSLHNVANRLSHLGRHKQALVAAEEVVRLRRVLTTGRPDAFMPDLATSLNNLASFLAALGRHKESLAAAEEALGLRRRLATARPGAFAPYVAGSLNNVAIILGNLERREEALVILGEAIQLYRDLTKARPDAFESDLAMSLSGRACLLSDLGRHEDALAAAEEALRSYRKLAFTSPAEFTPGLALTLNNLARFLRNLERRDEALAAAEEAVLLRRQLATAHPDAFTPDLAMSLSVLGDMLEATGKIDDAITVDCESISLLEPYYQALPVAFGQQMFAYLLGYLRRAEAAQINIDTDLVSRIVKGLKEAGILGGET